MLFRAIHVPLRGALSRRQQPLFPVLHPEQRVNRLLPAGARRFVDRQGRLNL